MTTIKLTRYMFAINQIIALGDNCSINLEGAPEIGLLVDKININVLTNGFITVKHFVTSRQFLDQDFDIIKYTNKTIKPPFRLQKGEIIKVIGNYTGLVPKEFKVGQKFMVSFVLHGEAI